MSKKVSLYGDLLSGIDWAQEYMDQLYAEGWAKEKVKPKCDCGAEKAKTTHALWCSTMQKEEEEQA